MIGARLSTESENITAYLFHLVRLLPLNNGKLKLKQYFISMKNMNTNVDKRMKNRLTFHI